MDRYRLDSKAELDKSISSDHTIRPRSKSRVNSKPESRPRSNSTRNDKTNNLYSLWELLLLELDLPCDNHQTSSAAQPSINQSYNELLNMIKIPYYLEKFMLLGTMVCFNSFLTLFTLVPLKIAIQLTKGIKGLFTNDNRFREHLRWVKRDVLTLSMIAVSLIVLSYSKLDISRMYHDIRGQAHIKLYVMFGVLEVADRLLASLGQDILNILFKLELAQNWMKFALFYLLAITYLSFHGYILIYQTVSLNVAANSYSNALLTLLVSNQFAELKGSVFKRFEREGLFQLTIADLTERYQLSLMVGIIATRNILQLSIDQFGLIPNSWNSWNAWVGAIFGPAIVVIGSEVIVDWLKHCYICKFNKFKPQVYQNFIHVLSLDYLQASKTSLTSSTDPHQFSDYITLMRRLGVPLLASIVCFLGMTLHEIKHVLTFPVLESYWNAIGITALLLISIFATLTLMRLILGIIILRFANHIKLTYKLEQASIKKKAEKSLSEKPKTPVFTSNYQGRRFSVLTGSLDLSSYKESYASAFIDSIHLPGIPNPELSTINPNTRQYIYDVGEKMKPNAEEYRNKRLKELAKVDNEEDPMNKVMRYEMSSKRIW